MFHEGFPISKEPGHGFGTKSQIRSDSQSAEKVRDDVGALRLSVRNGRSELKVLNFLTHWDCASLLPPTGGGCVPQPPLRGVNKRNPGV